MSYSRIENQEALEEAMSLAKGEYQRGLIMGYEALSGATLKGKAKAYGARYRRSANALMARLKANGLAREERGPHGKRILVIG